MELLFKERLRQIHPAFVFNNVDKYPSNEAFTVGAELAFKRLQSIGGIQFSSSECSAVSTAREKRNEIEHFEFSIEESEAKALVGQILSFIFSFSEEHLGLEWKTQHIDASKWYVLRQYAKFYTELLQKAEAKIESEELFTIECTSCHNMSFDVDGEKCLVCGHREEVLECVRCAEPYIYSACEFEEAEICPSCEWKEGYAAAHFEKY